MQEFNHNFHQLPNFLQSELVWYVGSHNGLSPVQILARHIGAADYWIAKKNTGHRFSPDRSDIFGNGPLGKQEIEALKSLADSQMSAVPSSSFALGLISRLTTESVRYLTQFKNNLLPVQARAQAEEAAHWHALHLAQEAARQLAQRQAQAAAQRQAEEAAQLLAQQQAEAAAQQLAQRQAEEAARQKARQQAEKTALSIIHPRLVEVAVKQFMERVKATLNANSKTLATQPSGNTFISVTGPKAMADALFDAEREIRSAIADFSQTAGTTLEAFSAMLYAFKQNGLDTQSIGKSLLQP